MQLKAYKDSKVCDVMLMKELHRRYHKEQPRTAGCRMVSLIILASDPPGVLGYGEGESVPHTKDQFMRG